MDKYIWVWAIKGKHQEASLRHTADFCPPWNCHSLCTMERGQLNDLVRCSCSTSNWKNVPEFSVTYWYSGLTGFLIMGQSGLPAVFHSRRARRHHLSQAAFSAWLSPEICKGISFYKRPQESRDEDTGSVNLDTTWQAGFHTETSLNKKLWEKKKQQQTCTVVCNREFSCITF